MSYTPVNMAGTGTETLRSSKMVFPVEIGNIPPCYGSVSGWYNSAADDIQDFRIWTGRHTCSPTYAS